MKKWTRDETLVALYLYYIIPFQKVSKDNPVIQEYAEILGRTPSALGMKIGNLGRLDPTLKVKNISGLSNGSKMDVVVWNEFSGDWEQLNKEFEGVISQYQSNDENSNIEIESPEIPKGRERFARISVRVNQGFFRSSVLAAYNNQCCITGLKQPELLVASHITPWGEDKDNRLNPRNGLCLNALHDKAFDRGLLGIDENFKIIFSPLLAKTEGFDDLFKPYENRMIRLPERLNPSLEFLKFHRENIFQS
ncbi:TPA: HNH endonuclease [Neisseria gonorrhoeae]